MNIPEDVREYVSWSLLDDQENAGLDGDAAETARLNDIEQQWRSWLDSLQQQQAKTQDDYNYSWEDYKYRTEGWRNLHDGGES